MLRSNINPPFCFAKVQILRKIYLHDNIIPKIVNYIKRSLK